MWLVSVSTLNTISIFSLCFYQINLINYGRKIYWNEKNKKVYLVNDGFIHEKITKIKTYISMKNIFKIKPDIPVVAI
jgi:hypothetical protein